MCKVPYRVAYKEARRYMRGLRQSGSGGQVVMGTDDEVAGSLLEMSVPAPDTSSGYKAWASSGARPKDIPRNPVSVYGRRGEWVSWDDFLGRKIGEVKRRGRRVDEGPTDNNKKWLGSGSSSGSKGGGSEGSSKKHEAVS